MTQGSDIEVGRAWGLLEEIIGEYRPDWRDSILEHARIVHDASLFLAGLFPREAAIDHKTIALGAILHDVGRSRAARIVEHGVKSGEIIREHGFPEAVARIGETHIGVGITRSEAADMGLPQGDYIPKSREERIVCYVDNLLYYFPEEGRHELRDTTAVVERFTRELGEAYGRRAHDFMISLEAGLGPMGMERFHAYVADLNRRLAGQGRTHSEREKG